MIAGFIADTTGSYVPAFYTFGALLILAFLLVFPVYCFKLDKTNESNEEAGKLESEEQRRHLGGEQQKDNSPSMEFEIAADAVAEKQEVDNHVVKIHHDNARVNVEENECSSEGVINEGLNNDDFETKL